jgi:hypothetical protein
MSQEEDDGQFVMNWVMKRVMKDTQGIGRDMYPDIERVIADTLSFRRLKNDCPNTKIQLSRTPDGRLQVILRSKDQRRRDAVWGTKEWTPVRASITRFLKHRQGAENEEVEEEVENQENEVETEVEKSVQEREPDLGNLQTRLREYLKLGEDDILDEPELSVCSEPVEQIENTRTQVVAKPVVRPVEQEPEPDDDEPLDLETDFARSLREEHRAKMARAGVRKSRPGWILIGGTIVSGAVFLGFLKKILE